MKLSTLALLILTASVVSFGQPGETMEIRLYFSDSRNNPGAADCAKVRAVTRKIPKTKAVAKAALEALFKGPTRAEEADELSSFFSEATRDILIGVKVKNGAAYINLKKEVVQKLGGATSSCGSMSYNASIEKTLKQFPAIKKIFFALDGSPADYYDWMQVGECPPELKNCDNRDF